MRAGLKSGRWTLVIRVLYGILAFSRVDVLGRVIVGPARKEEIRFMAKIVTKAWVEADDCTACEACVAVAPEAMEMDNDVAKVISNDAEFLKAHSEEIIQAAEECPCEAIKYESA